MKDLLNKHSLIEKAHKSTEEYIKINPRAVKQFNKVEFNEEQSKMIEYAKQWREVIDWEEADPVSFQKAKELKVMKYCRQIIKDNDKHQRKIETTLKHARRSKDFESWCDTDNKHYNNAIELGILDECKRANFEERTLVAEAHKRFQVGEHNTEAKIEIEFEYV